MKRFYLGAFLLVGLMLAAARAADEAVPAVPPSGEWRHEELRRFKAPEANQGVVADAEFLYVIANQEIGKYRRDTFERVGGWKGEKGGPVIHLNAGILHDGKLYCAHSNFPAVPMTSSIEVWDAATLRPVSSHSLGIAYGSLTWIVKEPDGWLACFAHYAKDKPVTGKDPAWTELVRFDEQWRRTAGWVFPPALVELFGGSSSSGGMRGSDGRLYVTGHDAKYLFVLEFPKAGSVLKWVDSIPMAGEGQSFAWDPAPGGRLYSIVKKTREVVESSLTGH